MVSRRAWRSALNPSGATASGTRTLLVRAPVSARSWTSESRRSWRDYGSPNPLKISELSRELEEPREARVEPLSIRPIYTSFRDV
jgi:hypothetical protein